MDCRAVLLFCLAVFLAALIGCAESRTKKVVIHVPYKVKKVKHTHTVYKTIHHHHTHHEHDPVLLPPEEHEHFHHMHIHDDRPGQHSAPVPHIDIPEFLPDNPIGVSLPLGNIPDAPLPHNIPNRHLIPLFKRNLPRHNSNKP